MYIPKWVPISKAINHVRAVQGLNQPEAQHLLVLALRDDDVKARDADTGKPIAPERWRDVARNPVHMPSLIRIEICVEDVLRHWPETLDARRSAQERMTDRLSIPALVPASTALSETIDFLRRADRLSRTDAGRTLREEVEYAASLNLSERAIECLRTACAAGNLTMLVVDPNSGQRQEVPAEYFDQRPFADLEFGSAFFRACEKPELVAADPLFKLVLRFRGWVHGFIEQPFRAWLKDPTIGPLAGPTMRPFFHFAAFDGSILREETPMSQPPPGRRGRKRGSGSIKDEEQLSAMLHLLRAGEASTVLEAARKVAADDIRQAQSSSALVDRLRKKFAKLYGTSPPTGQTWSDIGR